MINLIQKKCCQSIGLCLLMLMLWPLISGTNVALGQYYTTISTGQLDKSAYVVERYVNSVPELQKEITLKKKNMARKIILDEIALKAGLGIAYDPQLAVLRSRITVNFEKISVAEALKKVLKETDFQAALSRMREIVLKKRPEPEPISIEIKHIDQEISGTVTDAETGEPLPAVNVLVLGTNIGTSTDGSGNYSLTAPDDADSLRFSYIGYRNTTIAINTRGVINVQLGQQVQAFNEMIVTALGITRDERSIGYATQQVQGEDITYTNEKNVIGSLAGKVAGVQITGSSGANMGGTQKIKIRGVNSINGTDQPLIVVDGTPISNTNFSGRAGVDYGNLAQDINPESIASINVLKGPAASALYGIRGQYGVVMISTKKGSQGTDDFTIDLSSSFTVDVTGNYFPLQNEYGQGASQNWRTLPNGQKYVDLLYDESWGPRMDGTMVRQFYSFYPQDSRYGELTSFEAHPNNIKNYFETGYTVNNGFAISGGSDNATYRVSFNDTRIEGVEPNTWLKRNNLGVSANIDLSEKVNISTNINFATNNGQRPPQGYGSKSMIQWLPRNVDMNRLEDYRYSDGTLMNWNLRRPSSSTGEVTNFSSLYWTNPFLEGNENLSSDKRDRLFGNIGITYQMLPGLELSGFIRSDRYTQNIENRIVFRYGQSVPSYSVGKYQNIEMNYELLAQYTKSWSEFSLDATLGGNLFDRDYSYLDQATEGGLSTPGLWNIAASIDRPTTNSYLLNKKILSVYSLVSLGYKDTYFIDASLRNDKSSTLPESNNSYWYPSVSGSLVFSELINWEPLSFGKLRLSYAQAGADLDPYQTTSFYNTGTIYSGISPLTVPNSLNNPDIKPSFANSYEGGIDLRFLGRAGISFTYYLQRNKNQIIPLNVSGASGYGSATINAGLIENKGIELSLNGTPIQTESFSWDATFNLNRNRNMVVELYPGVDVYPLSSTTFSSVPTYLNSYEGKSFGSLIGQAYQRDQDTGKILLDEENLPLYTDATHDFGTVLPDFTGGFQNEVNYKNLTLSAMIDFQIGGQFFSRTKMINVRTGVDPVTVGMNDQGNPKRDPIDEGGGVKVEGISAQTGEDVTAYVNARDYYNYRLGRRIYEEWLFDASYIKLREVKLGYTFNNETLQRLSASRLSIGVFANNPLMIWQKAPQGLEPSELSTSGQGGQGISWFESGQLNTVRSFGIDLNITF